MTNATEGAGKSLGAGRKSLVVVNRRNSKGMEALPPALTAAVQAIQPLDGAAMRRARERQRRLTKPPGSLGRLEEVSIQVAGVQGTARPRIARKTLVVAAADHGVVAQSVTGYPQAVTAQMAMNFLHGGAAVNALARHANVDLVIVNAGVATPLPDHPALRRLGLGPGTHDISEGPAMTRRQAEAALVAGIRLADEAAEKGADVIGLGDMGIGNTTASSAVVAAMTREPPERTTGAGTGRTPDELARKTAIVQCALTVNRPDAADAVGVLAAVGGFEIGVLAGVILGTARARRPVVLDGFISSAAALLAVGLCPDARPYLVASHRSTERGHRVALRQLRLRPLLDLRMRLGEGTGAVLAMSIVEAAAACLSEMATFDEAGVSDRPVPAAKAR